MSAGGDTALARVVFALLVVACFAAFFITQRLKHSPTPVQEFKMAPYFSPTPSGHIKREPLSFHIEHSDDVTVKVVSLASGDPVATLASERPLLAYRRLTLFWDGLTSSGQPAPAGVYRLDVTLRRQDLSVYSARSFTLVRAPRRGAA